MSSSLPGNRALPESRYDLGTYWGRVRHAADISDPRTLLAGTKGLEQAKQLVMAYKAGQMEDMTPELWHAKKIVDSTLHPDTGEPVLLPFRMSCFVLSNLVVTAGMLTPGLGTAGTLAWQVVNQSLNVAINSSNANKSSPMTTAMLAKSFALAVGASCTVAGGLKTLVPYIKAPPRVKLIADRLVPFFAVVSAGVVNVYVMRAEERRTGIDVFPALSASDIEDLEAQGKSVKDIPSLGKSKIAADRAVRETAISRCVSATPIMAIPPLILVQLQQKKWLKGNMKRAMAVNVGLIGLTSVFALPLALGVFPAKQTVPATLLGSEFHDRGGTSGMVTFNRGL
ncbi:Tricarboxylate/iron carrier [Zalerion maritima]|uniref:Sidoreflexin n=1 Tax=Zalerion maritima TaxID=339359 RepID=A0AAD5WRS4_9PEZI|nr:Tricarboxylate/iron carrier [Zalerion maritima]